MSCPKASYGFTVRHLLILAGDTIDFSGQQTHSQMPVVCYADV